MKCSDTEYNGSPWEWRPLEVAAPGSGESWEWRNLGVAGRHQSVHVGQHCCMANTEIDDLTRVRINSAIVFMFHDHTDYI